MDVVARRIPRKFGLDPRRDVQVLAPMHRGAAGAGALNTALQEALTPAREGMPERRYGGRVFRVGDKVTQLRNNYDKGAAGVFNGTVGIVTGIRPDEQQADRAAPTRTSRSTTPSTSWTSSPTPTPSPSTAPRAANTRPWSSR